MQGEAAGDADALRVIGPHDCASGLDAHNQTGIPTRPTEPGRSSGTIPIEIGLKFMLAIACCANTTGSGPAGAVADQNLY